MLGLVRRSPTLGLSTLSDFDRLLDDFFSPFSLSSTSLSLPLVDIYSEDDRNMIIEMQAPGFDREDIEISVNNGTLEIRGQRTEKEEHKDKKRKWMVRESSSSFARRVALPEGADSEKIAAELNRGVLRVTIPVERAEAKRIEIAAPKSRGRAKLASLTQAKPEAK
jgi:HSP20 family protein